MGGPAPLGDRHASSGWRRSPSGSSCAAREATGAPLRPLTVVSACSPSRASSGASSGPEAARGARLDPRRARDDDLAGDALDGGDRGAPGAASLDRAESQARRRGTGPGPDRQLTAASATLGSAARSTTTWVTGSSISSRARSTTPRSSQRERSGGWVEITISSAGNTRSASSIATLGSESPISPLRLQAEPVDLDQRELHPLPRQLDRLVDVRGPVRRARGGQRRRDDEDLAVCGRAADCAISSSRASPPTVSLATTRSRCRPSPPLVTSTLRGSEPRAVR